MKIVIGLASDTSEMDGKDHTHCCGTMNPTAFPLARHRFLSSYGSWHVDKKKQKKESMPVVGARAVRHRMTRPTFARVSDLARISGFIVQYSQYPLDKIVLINERAV